MLELMPQFELKSNHITSAVLAQVLELASHAGSIEHSAQIPLVQKIIQKMLLRQPLDFILPAFPAKSPNLTKTSGIHPDLGEVLALAKLNRMCERISAVYAPGAQVLICSDGRVFSDVVLVNDQEIDVYSDGIREIIRDFALAHLQTFDLEDAYPVPDGPTLRKRLVDEYALSLEQVRALVQDDTDYRGLFNGVHKFILEDRIDLPQNQDLSKNQVAKQAKQATYELLRRSDAWSMLLKHRFPDALRLSIHAYPLQHEKFGISLVPAAERVATPWHNVTLYHGAGHELMHCRQALALGAQKKFYKEKYAYYEI